MILSEAINQMFTDRRDRKKRVEMTAKYIGILDRWFERRFTSISMEIAVVVPSQSK